jgi:serine/threonine protein kinase/WD40 repeat protein
MSPDFDPEQADALASWIAACHDAQARGDSPPEPPPDTPGPLAQQLIAFLGLLAPPVSAPEAHSFPAAVGPFQLRERLGSGTFGVVFRAFDPRTQRDVALKLPRHGTDADSARFVCESQLAAQFSHPGIVLLFEAGEADGLWYIASEYVPGPTLAASLAEHRQKSQPVPVAVAADLVAQLADAAQHAHERGVIHRDLKPANVLLSEPRPLGSGDAVPLPNGRGSDCVPKITDFGLARALDSSVRLTLSGESVGTPHYMAPEQTRGNNGQVGPTADVWSLGVILYELLTSKLPFDAADPIATMILVREDDPVPPRRLRRDLPRDLETIALKCLRKDPRERYPSAGELAADLRRFLRREPIRARPTLPWKRGWLWARRRPSQAGLLAVLGLAAVLGIVVLVLGARSDAAAALARERHVRLRLAAESEYHQGLAQARNRLLFGDVDRARAYLDRAVAMPEAERLRGFEWHLLRHLCDDPAAPKLRGRRHEGAQVPRSLGDTLRPNGLLALSPDRNTLAVVDQSGDLCLLDVATRHLRRRLGPTGDVVGGLIFLDDRRLITVGTRLRIWNTETGRVERTLGMTFPTAGAIGAAVCPAGRWLAVRYQGAWQPGSGPSLLAVWDLTRDDLTPFKTYGIPISVGGLVFSPNGRDFFYTGNQEVVRMNTSTWTEVEKLSLNAPLNQDSAFGSLALSPDGKNLAALGHHGPLRLWNISTNAKGPSRDAQLSHWDVATPAQSLAFGTDGQTVASAAPNGELCFWQVWPAKLLHHVRKLPPGRTQVAASSRPGEFICCSSDGALRTWSQQGLHSDDWPDTSPPPPVHALAFLPDGRQVVTAHYKNPPLTNSPWWPITGRPGRSSCEIAGSFAAFGAVWDVESGKIVKHLARHRPIPVRAFSLSHDGRSLALGIGMRGAWVYDTESAKRRCTVFTRLDSRLIAFGYEFYRPFHRLGVDAHNWDNDSEKLSSPAVAIDPPGRLLAVADAEGDVTFWDADSGERLAPTLAPAGLSRVRALAFSPDGKTLAIARDRRLLLWDVGRRTFRPGLPEEGLHANLLSLAYSPDGTRLAAGLEDGTFCVWDLSEDKLLHSAASEAGPVTGLAFSPDNRTLVTLSTGATAQMWSMVTGQKLLDLWGHTGRVYAAAFSRDGRRLATGGVRPDGRGELLLWEAGPAR